MKDRSAKPFKIIIIFNMDHIKAIHFIFHVYYWLTYMRIYKNLYYSHRLLVVISRVSVDVVLVRRKVFEIRPCMYPYDRIFFSFSLCTNTFFLYKFHAGPSNRLFDGSIRRYHILYINPRVEWTCRVPLVFCPRRQIN